MTAPKFCTQCGTSLPKAARFCSECGTAVGGATSAASPAPPRSWHEQVLGLTVLMTFLIAGLAMWVEVLRGGPNAATAPRPPGPPPGAIGDGQGMPANHPPVGLTDEAKQFLEQLTEKAEAAPGDASAWRNLAQVQARAAALDPSYGPRAVDSFRQLLSLAPDDADAVRALANVFYDLKRYADASAQYERYLELRPDDPNVRTDLGTTYLYRQDLERAIKTYQDVLAARPDFLQAHFNLGLAYEAQGDRTQALASIAKARSLADDATTRERIDRVVAELEGREPGAADRPEQAPPPPAQDATAATGAAQAPAAPPAADYRAALEQGLRVHPILGPKISAIEWPDDTRARVLLRDFPMDAMPDFARNLFRARLETVIYDAKEQFDVTDERTIELVDAASGATLDTVTQ